MEEGALRRSSPVDRDLRSHRVNASPKLADASHEVIPAGILATLQAVTRVGRDREPEFAPPNLW